MDGNNNGQLARRTLLQMGMFGTVAVGLAACSAEGSTPSGTSSAKPSSSAKVATSANTDTIVKAAQAEGGLNFYTAAVPNAVALLTGAFTGLYNIPVTVTRLVSEPLETKFTAEVQAGSPVADIIQLSDSAWLTATATKNPWLLTPTPDDVPAIKGWPSKYVIGDQAYLQALGLYDVVYNTQLVTGKDIPKKWKDILNPKWKGKIILPDPRSNNADLAWCYYMDKLYGDSFLTKLGALKPQLALSTAVGVNSVASGDAAMMVPTNHWSNTPLISAGAPLADAYPSPTTSAEEWMAIVDKSPHPNAAKLFFNYAISQAGQLAECKDLCTSVLNVAGTIPFPKGYVSPPVDEAVADRTRILGLLGLN